MPATETILATARRCVVAHRGTDGPGVAAVSCWSDGGGLWMLPARHPEMEAALRRDPSCVVWIPPETAGGTGVAIDGHARIFDTSDPIALALHAPAISAAVAGLALAHRGLIPAALRDLPRRTPPDPRRLLTAAAPTLPTPPRILRIRIDRARGRAAPEVVSGAGPALPTTVPPAVRRELTGVRHVVLVLGWDDGPTVQPAVWSAGFRLEVGAGPVPADGTPAVVVAERHDGAAAVGMQVEGTIDGDFRLRPVRASWWQGAAGGDVALERPGASGIVLPE